MDWSRVRENGSLIHPLAASIPLAWVGLNSLFGWQQN
jgi:hypothetical protein